MKKILLGMLVLGAMASCKKDKDDPSCEKSVAGIANTFKLSKQTAESSAGGGEQNVPLDACTLSGVYVLKNDKTLTYAETGAGCSTTPDAGTWDVVSGKLTVSNGPLLFSDMDIYTWDCTNLTVGFAQSGGGFTTTVRYYLVKQ